MKSVILTEVSLFWSFQHLQSLVILFVLNFTKSLPNGLEKPTKLFWSHLIRQWHNLLHTCHSLFSFTHKFVHYIRQPFWYFFRDIIYYTNASHPLDQVLISSLSHSGTLVLEVSCMLLAGGRGAMVFTKIQALLPQQAMSASTTDGPEKLKQILLTCNHNQ